MSKGAGKSPRDAGNPPFRLTGGVTGPEIHFDRLVTPGGRQINRGVLKPPERGSMLGKWNHYNASENCRKEHWPSI